MKYYKPKASKCIRSHESSKKTEVETTEIEHINLILKPVVKLWLKAKEDFVLEKDRDLGHKSGKSSIVRD